MIKKIVVLLIVLSVFMAACSSAGTELPTDPTSESPVETEAASTALPEVSPTSESGQATDQAEANCTVVSRQPTPGPTEESLVPAVSDEDWTLGSDDAAVTFIEYGDFQ